jgi:DNA-binding response OmpR family regulator
VAVTGFADESHRVQSEEAGFDLYCVKPLDVLRLIQSIKEHPKFAMNS